MAEDGNVKGFSLEEEELILEQRAQRSRRKKMKGNREIEAGAPLNINSMMDLMTIILVFLILSSNEQAISPEMSDELFMPWSTAAAEIEDTITITISGASVLVNDDYVISIREGDILVGDRVSATSPIIPKLQDELTQRLENEREFAARRGEEYETVATLIADHETTYQVLTYVMMTASAAGVTDFRFAILKRQPGQLFNDEG
ncbi:MAG: biopolymer transporter ExbD [Myxococcales bacterium]|nr:biopolymer transporter ExbD [Myxococcales bacterium]